VCFYAAANVAVLHSRLVEPRAGCTPAAAAIYFANGQLPEPLENSSDTINLKFTPCTVSDHYSLAPIKIMRLDALILKITQQHVILFMKNVVSTIQWCSVNFTTAVVQYFMLVKKCRFYGVCNYVV
jgi:hypothetical protein